MALNIALIVYYNFSEASVRKTAHGFVYKEGVKTGVYVSVDQYEKKDTVIFNIDNIEDANVTCDMQLTI